MVSQVIPAAASSTFRLSRRAHGALVGALSFAMSLRLAQAATAAWHGDIEPFVAFGFTAIFPATVFVLLLSLPPTRSAEGVLMRIGAAAQLILIVGFPSWGLLLLLGLPATFLAVELLETRAPAAWRGAVRRVMIEQ